MKQTLRTLFKTYGEVLDVVAHRNLRMRGQAFVSFADVNSARRAAREVRGFPLYTKPMVRELFDSGRAIADHPDLAANIVRALAVGRGGQEVR